uniref:V-type H+-transporting ATPase subunit F (ATPVF, ntpF) n=2 Tax=environmental samples TaxID=651140 RepID=A0A075H0B0_9ARCH|nr:V-type H+-transporting ATPase subunit F (ATPVF, ntpF) [uncultured marine thaumarchaeote KM3_31_E07]AIF08580.1 V-type H+-transporting ATPase subunit F (ATPVF, ntpF) [uncultured marine thaumarchaeote KM3_31_F07]
MRIVAIGSRVFTTSFQLGGVEGLKVDISLEALTEINKLIEKNDVGLILLSDDIAKDIQKKLIEIRAKTPIPLIFELPTPGSKKKKIDYRALFNQSLGV